MVSFAALHSQLFLLLNYACSGVNILTKVVIIIHVSDIKVLLFVIPVIILLLSVVVTVTVKLMK